MIIIPALIISVILQFTAAIIAVTLIKRTKTNIAWWLISTAFILMAVRRAMDLFRFTQSPEYGNHEMLQSWIAVAISFIMLLSLIFIKKIFNVQKEYEVLKRDQETRIISAVIETEERERKHFAQELHDGLGPLLSAVKMGFSVLSKEITGEKEVVLADNTARLIDQSLVSLKEISNNLSPQILMDHGLSTAVEVYISTLDPESRNRICFNNGVLKNDIPQEKSLALYRIICELIINGIKHSNADKVTLDISKNHNEIMIEYFDNGIGIPESEWEYPSGMGLSNISSRVRSINAEMHCDSKRGEGTRITIQTAKQ